MTPLRRIATLLIALAATTAAQACPFCDAESRTLTEEINDSSVVLLAKLAEPAAAAETLAGGEVPYGFVDPDTGAARFRVGRVLMGESEMTGVEEIEAIYFGEPDFERTYFVRGVGEPPDWAIPLPLSAEAVDYVPRLFELPPTGGERLAFFLDYLEHEDPLLGQDAYDEFARAPYADVIAIRDRMDRDQLLDWIEGGRVSPSRRRLFLMMLGVCGKAEDTERIEAMLLSDAAVLGPGVDAGTAASLAAGGPLGGAMAPELVRLGERQRKLGLDAMIACYLTLCGKHGDPTAALDLVDHRFLTSPDADYSHIHASIMALRFLVEEQSELVPVGRVLSSARLLLDNGDFADQVIPDLARWQDWSVLPRLAAMFEASVEDNANRYVREPIITYLDVAAEQEGPIADQARAALARVEPLDRAAVKRARSLRAFGFLAQARTKDTKGANSPAADGTKPGDPAGEFASADASDATTEADGADGATPRMTTAERVAQARARKAEAVGAPLALADPAPAAPSRLLLIGAPLVGAVVCLGVFWTIFRGGAA